jgi:tetratricopeptide (TPR) repeat protein
MADPTMNADAGTGEGMKRVTGLLSRIAQVGESGDSASGMSASDIAALVAQINQEYSETARPEVADPIPFFVFERMLEALGRRLERVASKQLLAALRALPHGIANAQLIRQLIQSLLRAYSEHLSRHPADADVRVDRAALNLAERRFEAVLADCVVLRASAPAPAQTPRLEVEAHIGLKEYESAYECLGRMLDADENDFFALHQRGQLHAAFHYAAEALADAKRLEQSSEPAHVLWCAGLYLSENRAADALRACQRALEHAPDDPEALFLLGEAQFCSGAWEASGRAFAALLASGESPADEVAWRRRQHFAIRRIADMEQRRGNPGKAMDGYGWLLSTGVYDYWALRSYVELAERWLRATLPGDSREAPSRATTTEPARPLLLPDASVPRAEAGMVIEQPAGGTSRIRIIDPENIVYLERLRWRATVEALELVELGRDNRAGFTALFELAMPALRSLSIRAERFGYACARKLIEAPFFRNLTALKRASGRACGPSRSAATT